MPASRKITNKHTPQCVAVASSKLYQRDKLTHSRNAPKGKDTDIRAISLIGSRTAIPVPVLEVLTLCLLVSSDDRSLSLSQDSIILVLNLKIGDVLELIKFKEIKM